MYEGDMDYVDVATLYAEDVVTGKIPACAYVKQACSRQLKDLCRPGKDGFRYRFDRESANRVCRTVELLPHIKGPWARQGALIELQPWQCFNLTTVFGWLDENGFRRFKVAYQETPRKNAKSTITSGIGIYLTGVDGEPGAEVYSAATTLDQAKIVWNDARRMVEKCEGIRRRFEFETSAKSIFVDSTASFFKPLTRDQGGNLDGLNVYGGLIDELHAHKTRDLYDVIETGTGSRTQPLLWLITTAGFNRAGICYEQRAYALRVLAGTVEDEEYFGIVYTIDDGDDWTKEASWIKANPNWGISVNPDDIRRKARKAMEMASATNNFLTKHLNVWVNADTAWMNMVEWGYCGDKKLSLDDFTGCEVDLGLDLASKIDITCKAYVFKREIGGVDHYYAFVRSYIPEEVAEDSKNSQYSGWVREGRLISTDGNVTDFGRVEEDIKEDADRFIIKSCAYDPWQAQYLANNITALGIPAVEYRPITQNMSEPMKMLEALVRSRRFHHEDCPALNWMMSNVVAHTDANENIFPRKEFAENKIDGPVALITALGRALAAEETEDSIYNTGEVGV